MSAHHMDAARRIQRAWLRSARGRLAPFLLMASMLTSLAGCGGGGGSTLGPPQPPAFSSVPQVKLSKPPTFAADCDGVAATGTLYTNTVAEPYLAVNPTSPMNLIAGWQQNRWSDGGSQGLNLAASFDGGRTWTLSNAAFSRCTGGTSSNGGDYARATDVWISVSPSGVVYALSLSFTGGTLAAGSTSAMLVAKSLDGGSTWSAPTTLIQDGSLFFNDKGSLTADPTDANHVYAVWDRLTGQSGGPSYFAVTADAGTSWAARSIFDPGTNSQTIGNVIVVTPNPASVVIDVFVELGPAGAMVRAIRSSDHGTSWSLPVTISTLQAVGTRDPRPPGTPVRDGSDLVSAAVGPGGIVYVVWQDSRFSSGVRDGIAMSVSTDGGMSWSVPVEVNADTGAQAFTPTINVRADGVIGVTYYDLRNDVNAPTGSLLADCWLVTSSDGVTFRETHLSGPFDLYLAPNAEGLFLGDYESLVSGTGDFLPLYVQTDPGTQVRSDVFIAFPPASASAQETARASFEARALQGDLALPAEARARVMERIRLTLAQRRHHPG